MAKFRDTIVQEPIGSSDAPSLGASNSKPERALGDIIRDTRNLSADQVEKILAYQHSKGVRFGEAAIALGFVDPDDVLAALSQQFNYPYASPERRLASPELVALNEPFSAQAEAFRGIRSQVVMRTTTEGEAKRALAIISPNRGDGKTFFCANLAVALAQLGGRTLLIDADLRGPRQHQVFDLDGSVGLSRVLAGRTENKVIQRIEGVPNLYVMPAGAPPPNPLELLERPTFGFLIRELVGKFDHVVVDTAAAEYGSDAAVAAARSGTALVVARNDRSRLAALQDLTGMLSGSPVKLLGVVTNQF